MFIINSSKKNPNIITHLQQVIVCLRKDNVFLRKDTVST